MIGYGAAATAFAGLALLLVIRRESGVLKRLRATPLPGWAYITAVLGSIVFVFSSRRSRSSSSAGSRSTSRCRTTRSRLVAALAPRRRLVRGAGRRTDRSDPQRRGLVGRRQRDLPPARLHLGLVLLVGRLPGGPPRDRGGAAACPLHPPRPRRDGLRRPDLGAPGEVAMIVAWGVVGAVVAFRGFRWEPRER